MSGPTISVDAFVEYESKLRKIEMLGEMAGAVQEVSFADRMLYWNDVCLDTTSHAVSALQTLYTLQGRKKTFGPDMAERLLTIFFDESSGGFRHHKDSEPSCYAVDVAYRLIEDLSDGRIQKFDEKAKQFILKCQDTATGGFSDTPFGVPALSSTLSAIFALSRIERECELKLPHEDKLAKFIMECKKSRGPTTGFADKPSDREPLICSTAFALRLLDLMKLLRKFINDTEAKKILAFTESCYDQSEGGYGWSPFSSPTLIHTRWALRAIESLTTNDLLVEKSIRCRPMKILHYVMTCELNGGFNFAKNKFPTIYSTRSALQVLRYLKLLERYFGMSQDYQEQIAKFIDAKREKIETFIDSCKSSETFGYAGMPRVTKSLDDVFRYARARASHDNRLEVEVRNIEKNVSALHYSELGRLIFPVLATLFLCLSGFTLYLGYSLVGISSLGPALAALLVTLGLYKSNRTEGM